MAVSDGEDWATLLNFSAQTGWEGKSRIPDFYPTTILSPHPSLSSGPKAKNFVPAESPRITTGNNHSLGEDLLLVFSPQNGTELPHTVGGAAKPKGAGPLISTRLLLLHMGSTQWPAGV